jgi:hypothetical protein
MIPQRPTAEVERSHVLRQRAVLHRSLSTRALTGCRVTTASAVVVLDRDRLSGLVTSEALLAADEATTLELPCGKADCSGPLTGYDW